MITIRRISADNPFYEQAIALREQALLRPIGLDFQTWLKQFPGYEDRMEHFVAILDHPTGPRVVGCAGLVVEEDAPRGRVVQMAVDPQRQGEGIGRRLLSAVEARAIGDLGLSTLYCHAQSSAVGFYERQGWKAVDEEFEEAGIPHRVMTMAGSGPDPQASGPDAFAPQ